MEAMCHTSRERKSKFLDKGCSVEREKERKKRKERKGKKGQKWKRGSHFSWFWSCLWEESRREKEE